jgi:DNA-binding beta-propeller fold protein YncE
MRMKLNKTSQLALVTAGSLLVATMLTACETLTVDFVFVTSAAAAGTNNYGSIDVFEINSESGQMRQIPTSPFPSGGRNPVAEAVSSDNTNLFVVNRDDNTIEQFLIGNDGKVYPQNTTNTPGIFPIAVAVSGTNVFEVNTYQELPTCSPAAPCSGSVAVFPVSAPITSNIGTAGAELLSTPVPNGNLNYWPLNIPSSPNDVFVPTAVNALKAGNFIYVAGYDSSVTPTIGYVFGFWIVPLLPTTGTQTTTVPSGVTCPGFPAGSTISAGDLTPGFLCVVNGGVPLPAGTHPSGMASDASSSYVYMTDTANSDVFGFAVGSGPLTPLSGSPYQTGAQPSSVVVDPTYAYVYVANAEDSTVTEYSTNSGVLTSIGTIATGLQPVAIGIDPSTNRFLFTVNFLGSSVNGTVSGFEMNTSTGALLVSKDSPYKSNALPNAVAAIPHKGTGAGIEK